MAKAMDRVESYHRWTAGEVDRAGPVLEPIATVGPPRPGQGRRQMYRLFLADDVLEKIDMPSRACAAGRLPVTASVHHRGAKR